MSAVEDVVTEAPAVEAVPKRAMTLGLGHLAGGAGRAGPRAAVRQELHHLPDDDAPDLRPCGSGAEHPDRRKRPVLAGSERVLRGRRLHVGDPDGTRRHELRADAADRGRHLLWLRIPVRPAGAAAFRRLSRAGDVCACHRDAATAQARLLRALDRRRAGSGRDQTRRAVRPADVAGHVAVLLHARDHDRHLHRLGQPAAVALGPRLHGDPRQRDRGVRAWASTSRCTRRWRSASRPASPALPAASAPSRCSSWRPTATPSCSRSRCSSAWSSAASAGCRARSSDRAFIIFVPNIAEGISKGLSGAVFGVLLFLVIFLVPHGARQVAIVAQQLIGKLKK